MVITRDSGPFNVGSIPAIPTLYKLITHLFYMKPKFLILQPIYYYTKDKWDAVTDFDSFYVWGIEPCAYSFFDKSAISVIDINKYPHHYGRLFKQIK